MNGNRNDPTNEEDSSLPNRRELLTTGMGIVVAATLMPSAASGAHAQEPGQTAASPSSTTSTTKAEQEVIDLSRDKWKWLSERKVDALADLFHEKAVFVHMGGSMSRTQELDTIKGGGIQYKNADIQKVSVEIIDTTAILLSTIRLLAVVGGNEVTNPFVVTEVYVKQSGKWKLASLSFTRTFG